MKKTVLVSIFVFLGVLAFSQPTFALSSTVCEGSSVLLTANAGTMSVTGYTWSTSPSGPLISAQNSSITSVDFSPSGSYTVTLDVDDGITVTTVSNTITVFSNPVVSISAMSPICPPPTPIGVWMTGSGANTFTWSPGGCTGSTYSVTQPSSDTWFTLYGEDSNGCSDTAMAYVQVLPAPVLFPSGPSIVCSGVTNCFSASGSLMIYYWTGPCGFSDGNQNPCFAINPGCGGTFTVGGTDMNSCLAIATIGISVSPCTSVDELDNDDEILPYPNPVSDKLYFENKNSGKELKIEISDITGNFIEVQNTSSALIDMSTYKSGVYFVKVIRGGSQSNFKVIKE